MVISEMDTTTTISRAEDNNTSPTDAIIDPRLLPFYIPEVWKLCFQIIFAFMAIIGTFGNIITILAVVTTKNLQTIPNYYVVSLAVADLITCVFVMPMAVLTYSYEYQIPVGFCQVISYVTMIVVVSSMIHLGIIAINRYILICRSRGLYNRIFSKRNVIISIACSWMFCFIEFSPPFFGFGSYGFNPFFGTCQFSDSKYTFLFVLILADCTVVFPSLFITLFCYIAIFMKFRQSQARVMHTAEYSGNSSVNETPGPTQEYTSTGGATSTTSGAINNKQSQEKKKFSVTKNLFVIWVAFVIFWLPAVILHKIDNFRSPFGTMYHFTWLFTTANSMGNFLIYGAMNMSFRKAYIRLCTPGKH